MGEKHWIQDFATGLDRLRVHFSTQRGDVTSIDVIQYEAFIDGEWRAIVRYDEAHGFFHKDVLSPTGEQQKFNRPEQVKSIALTEAMRTSSPTGVPIERHSRTNIMKAIEEGNITSHNLDRLKSLLTGHSNSGPNVVEQIPNKAHIFHGAYDDSSLTHANLQLASRILLGMTLGYVDEAPLIMIFEERSDEFRVIDLLDENHLEKAEAFVETFQRQSEQDMGNTLKEHLTA